MLKGLAAGAAGTATMTGHQKIRQWLGRRVQAETNNARAESGELPDRWEAAPAPAQVGKRLLEALLGWDVPLTAIPALTQVMHWSYGTLWGVMYAAGRDSSCGGRRLLGPLFGLGVWVASYAQLVPLGIYEPPWRYPWSTVADELGYHVTYGTTVALTYALLDGGTA
jgi:hypothetical protein